MHEDPAVRRKLIEKQFPVWTKTTVSGAFISAAERYADRPFILTRDRIYPYAEIRQWAQQLASGLIAYGLKPGEHVALVMANYPAFAVVKIAIAMAGAVAVPVNFLLRGQELAYVLRQSDAAMLITMDRFRGHDYLADLSKFAPDWREGKTIALPQLRQVFTFPTDDGNKTNVPTLEDLMARANSVSDTDLALRLARPNGDSLSDIVYTSGTTGQSKGVMLTHDMVMRAAFASAYTRAFEDGRRIQFALPMYHVFGYVECMLAATFVGGAIIPHTTFDPAEMLDLAESLAASELVCVPMMTHKLIELAKSRGFNSTSLLAVFNSGGVNVPTVWHEIRATLGAPEVLTAYGMTETTASTTCTLPEADDLFLISTNGRFKPAFCAGDPALGGFTAIYKSIDPETLEDLPTGSTGELVVTGPIVTNGYYNKPDETASAFTKDVWLRTGDIGRVDEAGNLTLTGRLKETYRCGGEMVMPREIEALFDDWPGIAQVLAVGIPDPKMGEIGVLGVVRKEGETPPRAERLLAHCTENLARFKIPRHVIYLDAAEVPLTVTGRPQKFKLAAELAKKIKTLEETK
jgi:fatty-acyl-CoA synthase